MCINRMLESSTLLQLTYIIVNIQNKVLRLNRH